MGEDAAEEMETVTNFTHQTDELPFKHRHYDLLTTEVSLVRPPKSLSSFYRPWIVTLNRILRHPLTSKPHSFKLPRNFYFSQLNSSTLSIYYTFSHYRPVDKLLLLQSSQYHYNLFVLYGGGQFQGCPRCRMVQKNNDTRHRPPWVKLSHGGSVKFDDIIDFQDKVYAIDRHGITKLVNHYKNVAKMSMGKTLIFEPLTPGSGQFGWRKRFAVNGDTLYVVVRIEEKFFKVFRFKSRVKTPGTTCYYWDRVKRFEGNKVLFMGRDCCFFLRASRKFPGREYRNCIVFSEAAFPQYGRDCWEFTQSDDRQFSEDDIAVFRLGDQRFAREEELENSGFPKIDWSPPDWIFNVSSFSTDEFKKHSSESEPSSSQSESGDKNVGEAQSDLKETNSKDDGEQEEMETEFSSQHQDQGGVASDSESKDQDDKKMQCDSNSREKEDEETHSKEAIIEGDTLLQKDPVMPSRSAIEEVTRTHLRTNSENDTMEEGPQKKCYINYQI